jgi:lysozyme family protein
MNGNFEECLALVLKHEGGFVNNPRDPGGMTNLGVTKVTYEGFVNRHVDEAEMRSLTPDLVAPLYKKMYWDRIKGDDLPVGVDYCLFDLAVNSGVGKAGKLLQMALDVPADGLIGPMTLRALESRDPEEIIQQVCQERLDFLQSLNTWNTFGKGWGRRVAEVEQHATAMIT